MGIPNQIVTDNGSQLQQPNLKNFARTTLLPLIIQVQMEKLNVLCKLLRQQKEKGEVQLNLSKFLLRYRTTPHSATGKSPAELIFGRQIKTRLDLLHPDEIK